MLGAAVAVLLSLLGLGAALLPASSAHAPSTAAPAGGLAGTGGSDPLGIGSLPPIPPSASPATPGTARSTAAPKAAPTRKTSTPPRTPSRTTARTTSGGTQVEQVVALVNAQRKTNGCGTVTINTKLSAAARAHSEDQAAHNTMSHTGSDGSSPWERAERAGYQDAIGENVAYGYRTPQAVMDGWMNSPGHRANILNCQAKAIGVGVAAAGNGSLYWTQMFGSAV